MQTTLNIHANILRDISEKAQSQGISRSEVIISLLKKVINDIKKNDCFGKPVQYQKKSQTEDWHRFHVRLKDDEYEYFLDLRKVMKMSVSLILAFAVKKYLGKTQNYKNSDNYRFQSYSMYMEIVNNAIIWKIYWGFQPNIKNYIY